jgi:hypothetical protein
MLDNKMTEAEHPAFRRPAEYADTPDCPDFPRMIEKLALSLVLGNRAFDSRGLAGQRDCASASREVVRGITGIEARKHPDWDLVLQFKTWNTPTGAEEVVARPVDEPGEFIESFALYKVSKDPMITGTVEQRLKNAVADLPQSARKASRERILKKSARYSEYLWESAMNRTNDAEEEAMLRDLQMIATVLERWGIAMETDPVALGFGSLMKPASKA